MRCARTSSADVDQNNLFYPPNFILFHAIVSNRPATLGLIILAIQIIAPKVLGRFETVARNKIKLGGQTKLIWSTSALDILAHLTGFMHTGAKKKRGCSSFHTTGCCALNPPTIPPETPLPCNPDFPLDPESFFWSWHGTFVGRNQKKKNPNSKGSPGNQYF